MFKFLIGLAPKKINSQNFNLIRLNFLVHILTSFLLIKQSLPVNSL